MGRWLLVAATTDARCGPGMHPSLSLSHSEKRSRNCCQTEQYKERSVAVEKMDHGFLTLKLLLATGALVTSDFVTE